MKSVIAILIAWLLCAPSYAALEDWHCQGLADFYGFVAVDRDAGVPLKDSINKTVRNIITVMDNPSAALDVEADDALALMEIVRYVYAQNLTPRQVKRAAQLRCMVGQMEAPRPVKPARGI